MGDSIINADAFIHTSNIRCDAELDIQLSCVFQGIQTCLTFYNIKMEESIRIIITHIWAILLRMWDMYIKHKWLSHLKYKIMIIKYSLWQWRRCQRKQKLCILSMHFSIISKWIGTILPLLIASKITLGIERYSSQRRKPTSFANKQILLMLLFTINDKKYDLATFEE